MKKGNLTVVVDGFYGSCGKGKIVNHLAVTGNAAAVVRTGGMNAGHWYRDAQGREHCSRLLPTGYGQPNAMLVIGAGGMVEVSLLMSEIKHLESMGFEIGNRLKIDPNAVVASEYMTQFERMEAMSNRFGSTQTGTGAATIGKILRNPEKCKLAKDEPELRPFLADTSLLLNDMIDTGSNVILEGTQGFGLSLHHSWCWPYCTSRDTSAAGFLSEAGLSPRLVTDVVVVFRTYPIRVGGNSGPMWREIDWQTIYRRCGMPEDKQIPEMTSVTKKLRRVGEFDYNLAARAISVNRPTMLAIHGLDYLNYDNFQVRDWHRLDIATRNWITSAEERLEVPIQFLYTGPLNEDLIDRRGTFHNSSVGANNVVIEDYNED